MRNFKNFFLFVFALAVLSSCGTEDDGGSSSPIIGSWSFSSVAITELTINGQDLETYLEAQGLSEEEIDQTVATIEGSVEGEFDWNDLVIQFNSNNSYLVTQTGEADETGTWSLSEDGKVLTVDDEQFDVKTLTSSQLVVGQTHEETNDEGEFSATVELTFSK